MTQTFQVGDKVRVKSHLVGVLEQPLRRKFRRRRFGTVCHFSLLDNTYSVDWNTPRGDRYAFTLVMNVTDLELVP